MTEKKPVKRNRVRSNSVTVMKKWADENLPPLPFFSLAHSTINLALCVAYWTGLMKDFQLVIRLCSAAALAYIALDTWLEIKVLGRYTYIVHHVVTVIIFVICFFYREIGYPEQSAIDLMVVMFCAELSTMVVNIRFCVSQGMLTVFRYTTVTIIEDANEALDNEKGEKKLTLHEEILFIVSYGAIRVLVMPYILFGLVKKGSLTKTDPILYLSLALVGMSGKWTAEWAQNTYNRYSKNGSGKVTKQN